MKLKLGTHLDGQAIEVCAKFQLHRFRSVRDLEKFRLFFNIPVSPVAEMGRNRLVLFRSADQGQFMDPCSGKRGRVWKTNLFLS